MRSKERLLLNPAQIRQVTKKYDYIELLLDPESVERGYFESKSLSSSQSS